MVTFVCRRCNFKYKPRMENARMPLMCHNCGGKETVGRAPNAEQIIKESEKF